MKNNVAIAIIFPKNKSAIISLTEQELNNLIRSGNNVISAFINQKGEIINQIKSTERGFIEIKSFVKSKKTPFSSSGNKIFFYFLIFYISLFFFLKKRENK